MMTPSAIWYFLLAAFIQNVVLTTGLGSSLMLRVVRRPRVLVQFGVVLLFFTTVVTALFYPLDHLVTSTWLTRMLRPVVVVLLTALLYLLIAVLASKFLSKWYRNARRLLPLAAFNTVVVGVGLLINHQVSLTFWQSVALAAGAAVGFTVISAITAEGVSRVDNPDTPAAFRGLPASLVYLGLLALAMMGFSPFINLV